MKTRAGKTVWLELSDLTVPSYGANFGEFGRVHKGALGILEIYGNRGTGCWEIQEWGVGTTHITMGEKKGG